MLKGMDKRTVFKMAAKTQIVKTQKNKQLGNYNSLKPYPILNTTILNYCELIPSYA